MRKIIFTPLFFILSFSSLLNAQDKNNPWQLSLGTNVVDTYKFGETPSGGIGELSQDFITINDWNFGGLNFTFSRFLSKGLNIGIEGSISTITEIEGSSNADISYYSVNGFIKYSPFYKWKLSPYISAGYGVTHFNTSEPLATGVSPEISKTIFGGAGITYKINKQFGVFISTGYRIPTGEFKSNHFQHQVGFNFNFNFISDKDKDGVPDNKDQCPDEAGLKTLNGCPDSDNDSVVDSKDECPNVFGDALLNGCPDADGDGVIDKNDLCPNEVGTIEMNGCPDSDGDGVPDAIDECPIESGSPENNGCPIANADNDSDGDGIVNTQDKCPEIPGNIANEGCPEISQPVLETLNELGSQIIFPSESASIFGKQNIDALFFIKETLLKNPNGQLLIEGYSSSDGSDEYNQELSKQRAISVRNYLIDLGIDPDRLEVVGLGEDNPIGDNDSVSGRAINRRVQFMAKF